MQAVVLFAVLFNCLPVFKAQEYKVVYKRKYVNDYDCDWDFEKVTFDIVLYRR
jgi:hypothetical protein